MQQMTFQTIRTLSQSSRLVQFHQNRLSLNRLNVKSQNFLPISNTRTTMGVLSNVSRQGFKVPGSSLRSSSCSRLLATSAGASINNTSSSNPKSTGNKLMTFLMACIALIGGYPYLYGNLSQDSRLQINSLLENYPEDIAYSLIDLFFNKIGMEILKILFDAEDAHNWAIWALAYGLLPRQCYDDSDPDFKILANEVLNIRFSSPVGLAAGFDKHAEGIDSLVNVGFSFVEIGSVTPVPQPGNEKPRNFRLVEDRAVINRYGFNSVGMDVVESRLLARHTKYQQSTGVMKVFHPPGLLGVNLGKNKLTEQAEEDYVKGIQCLGPYADYIVINVSSPNTPGLRSLQRKGAMSHLISTVLAARPNVNKYGTKPPVLIKIAPDLNDDEIEDIANVVQETKIDGMIISNTTISRPESLQSRHAKEMGGLSGEPVKELSTQVIRKMYRKTRGTIPIIGVGGIGSGADAYEKIKAGASLVQVYSMMVYEGPFVAMKIKRDLVTLLRKDGYLSIGDAIGADHQNIEENGERNPSIVNSKLEKDSKLEEEPTSNNNTSEKVTKKSTWWRPF